MCICVRKRHKYKNKNGTNAAKDKSACQKDILKHISNFFQFFFLHVDRFCILHNYIHKLQFRAPVIIKPTGHTPFLAYLITCYKIKIKLCEAIRGWPKFLKQLIQSTFMPTFQSYAVQTISASNPGGHIQISANHSPSKNLGTREYIRLKATSKDIQQESR